MYLFIYKTTHISGRYYIGRHQTSNINDGYLGSGKWVSNIKDKTSLIREIIAEATSKEELCELEEHYISLHYDDPLCMNMMRGSNGNTSEDAREIQKKLVSNGTHHFLKGDMQRENVRKRVANGTHNFQGPENNNNRVAAGTHPLLGGKISRENANKRVADGTHHFQGDAIVRKQLKTGTHTSHYMWTCPHCSKSGKGKGNFLRHHNNNCKFLK